MFKLDTKKWIYRASYFCFCTLLSTTAQADYTLLRSMQITPQAELKCDLVVLVNFEQAHLQVMRLESRKEERNISSFMKDPEKFSNHGEAYSLSSLFPDLDIGHELNKVAARFEFKDGEQNLLVIATTFDNQKVESRQDISSFLKPSDSCL